jgi:hypothetical protein
MVQISKQKNIENSVFIAVQIFLLAIIFFAGTIAAHTGYSCNMFGNFGTACQIQLYSTLLFVLVVFFSIIFSLIRIKKRIYILLFSVIISPILFYLNFINFISQESNYEIRNTIKKSECIKQGGTQQECTSKLFN